MNTAPQAYSLEQLAQLAELPLRTVRYYIQKGLVPRPDGNTRGASYELRHLECLLRIRSWTQAGLSLTRIQSLLNGQVPNLPELRQPGTLEVCTHVLLAEGVELVIAPERAGLQPGQVRELIRTVLDVMAKLDVATSAAQSAATNGEQDP